jgi:signal transduction histidine kinase
MSERATAGRGTPRLVPGVMFAVLAVLAVLGLVVLDPDRIYAHAAQAAELATFPIMLAAAAMLYVYFRLTPQDGTAWLATAAVFGTTQAAGYAVLRIVMQDEVRHNPGWLMLTQVVVAAVLVGLTAAQRVLRDFADPLLVGLGLGLAVTTWRVALVDRIEPSPALERSLLPLAVLLLVLFSGVAVQLVRSIRLPRWAALRLGAVVGVLGAGQVLTYPAAHNDARSVVAVGLFIVGNALLAMTSVNLVREALTRQYDVQRRVETLEALRRQDRTLIHEMVGTVAGITAASRLLALKAGLPLPERRRLQELLAAEAARVDRLAWSSRDEPLADVDLDPLISSLLLAQGIRGRVVAWRPTGDRVRARADDLVEVLTLLLDNAALHSGTTTFEVVVRRHGAEVAVAVVDDGRGIPSDIAPAVTDWGARGAGSLGQGIGLAEARRLVDGMDGRLLVASAEGVGTRVSVVLPATIDEVVAAGRSTA